jgi:type IV pilus assembly protein PilC
MARFTYQARDGKGQAANGVVTAGSLEEAGALLRGEGKFVIRLTPTMDADAASVQSTAGLSKARVKRQDVIYFTHQLAVMVDTGVALSEALDCAAAQTQHPEFKKILADVATHVQGGSEFSNALAKYPKAFPPIMVSLIRASEMSGTMGVMLDRIARYMSKEQQVLKQARGALYYPLFMLLMAVTVTIFLMTFVLPRFSAIYASKNAILPGPTRMLLAMSAALTNYWYLWLAGLALLIGAWLLLRRTPRLRYAIDWLKLHFPLMGKLTRQLYLTRSCRTMATMLASGVSMLDMISIARQVTDNRLFDELWTAVDERLRRGEQLSEPLFASSLIPRSVAQMIYSGERSGRLGKVLDRVADFTEEEFDTLVKTTTQFIEPVMVVVMGSIVGFIAIALLLPIFSMGKVVAGG